MSIPNHVFTKLVSTASVLTVALALEGCFDSKSPTTDAFSTSQAPLQHSKSLRQKLASQQDVKGNVEILQGIEKVLEGEYILANHHFNSALLENPSNSTAHYLNGLAYHLQAQKGDIAQYDLAEAGYHQAIKFNPHNTQAVLQLGRLHMEKKEYLLAQEDFANVLLVDPQNKDALYELASASYSKGDMKHAQASINQYLRFNGKSAEGHRAAALIHAALGHQKQAQKHYHQYALLDKDVSSLKLIERRMDDFRHLHKHGHIMLAQADSATMSDVTGAPAPIPAADASGGAPAGGPPPAPGATPSAAEDPQMVVIDAVVLRVSEGGSTQKGNNILDNFSLTLSPGTHLYGRHSALNGATLGGPAVTRLTTTTPQTVIPSAPEPISLTPGANSALSAARFFGQGISFGTVNYSMKIANSMNNRVEIIGRPTLVVSPTKKATFFSGTELVLGIAGQFGGSITKTPVGITLEVTLNSIQNNQVTLDINIYGSILSVDALANNVQNSFSRIGISRIQTSIAVPLNETVMLGGILERQDEYSKEGFPLLQDIPLIQYFFSKELTSNSRKSVMYLMTPRSYQDTVKDARTNVNDAEKRHNLTELEMRNKDWYDPRSNTSLILKHLTPLYREFRTGDIKNIKWDYPEKIEQDIDKLGSFIYY